MVAPASPSRQTLTLYAGRDVTLIFPAVNDEDGAPYVFEAETVVSWWLGLSKVNPLVTKSSLLPDEITVVGNMVQVRIKHADTTTLKPSSSGRTYMQELEVIDPDGNKFSACIGEAIVRF